MVADYPPAPPEEESRDACCGVKGCGSLFHSTAAHPRQQDGGPVRVRNLGKPMATLVDEWPEGYQPDEADKFIGRDPRGSA